jgi:HD-like signal output (HDOD) protein/ActR/RegA family two-component response regulator
MTCSFDRRRDVKRLLFVDDEARLLDALARMLRPRRLVWDMTFVQGGQAAIDALDSRQYDIIVTDMRMPDVDGLAVLRHARDRSARTVRIALSGQTELDVMARSVSLVHQFIAKPCRSPVLTSVLDRICTLQSLLDDPLLQYVVGTLGELPVLPKTYTQFVAAIEDPDVSLRSILQIVEQDVAIAARCLQLANSAFFGLTRSVVSLEQAVRFLGIAMLRDLVLSSVAFSSFKPGGRLTDEMLARLERHAVSVAKVARGLLEGDERDLAQQAFTAGMLHEIGELVLADGAARPGDAPAFEAADVPCTAGVPRAAQREDTGGRSEARLDSVAGAEVGAYLLGLWGLPLAVVEAVAYYRRPLDARSDRFDVLAALYTAEHLVQELDAPAGSTNPADDSELRAFLRSVGADHRLPAFRATASALVEPARA